jgi:hypothetical protein
MKLTIGKCDHKFKSALRESLEAKLREKLERLSEKISSIALTIRDLNGPKGGVDQEIRVVARLVTGNEIVVRHRTANVLGDFPSTIRRVVRAARSELSRRRDQSRDIGAASNK